MDPGREFVPRGSRADEQSLGLGLVPQHRGDGPPRGLRLDHQTPVPHHQVDNLLGGHAPVPRAAQGERDRVPHGDPLLRFGLFPRRVQLFRSLSRAERPDAAAFPANLLRPLRLADPLLAPVSLHGTANRRALLFALRLLLWRLLRRPLPFRIPPRRRLGCAVGPAPPLLLPLPPPTLPERVHRGSRVVVRAPLPHDPLLREVNSFLVAVVVHHAVFTVGGVVPRDAPAVKLGVARPEHQQPAADDVRERAVPGLERSFGAVELDANPAANQGAGSVLERVPARGAALRRPRLAPHRVRHDRVAVHSRSSPSMSGGGGGGGGEGPARRPLEKFIFTRRFSGVSWLVGVGCRGELLAPLLRDVGRRDVAGRSCRWFHRLERPSRHPPEEARDLGVGPGAGARRVIAR